MYIKYNENKYTCKCQIFADTIVYRGLSEDFPETVDGEITLCDNGGAVLRVDKSSDYLRQTFADGVLTLTNIPEPEPIEPTDPVESEPSTREIINAILGVTE